ncbi:MAG: HAD family hydrolase [Chloroflexi bacterium]|nr:HAD family hydrolase [Chloroflexota bacterium]
MNRTIQAVLFDLGDTLMYSLDSWPPVYERAGRKLSQTLRTNGITIDEDTFPTDFQQRLDKYYTDRDHNLFETSTMAVLHDLLSNQGHPSVPKKLRREALDHFYATTQQNWQLEEDAIPTMTALQQAGYHLGLVSNAGDNRDVIQLAKKFGIGQYFDFILTSAACGYRKPHPRIFELALANWGYMPDEIAMIGDRLDADVSGARPLGIFTIWIKRRAKKLNSPPITPDAAVETLSEIPALLSHLSKP